MIERAMLEDSATEIIMRQYSEVGGLGGICNSLSVEGWARRQE
jgi:hypothetical protein